MTALLAFARLRGVILVFLSQIDRSFQVSGRGLPDAGDVRLPNPRDVKLFNRTCFLHKGQVAMRASR